MAVMRRQSIVKFGAPLCETIVETPKPQGREVLIRVERCGLCHSDLHILDGYTDMGNGVKVDTTVGRRLPLTMGHEIAGVIEDVGEALPKDLIGRKKAVFPWIGCGACRFCQAGEENLCNNRRFMGAVIDGGYASHALVPDEKYLLDYDPISVNFAASLMCSGITAYGGFKRLAIHPRKRNILLIGLGGVGMMGLAIAPAMFSQPIAVADINPNARAAALQNGAAVAYDPAEPGIEKRIIAETDGGYDLIMDFVGGEKSLAFAMAALARGGKIVVSGLYGGAMTIPLVNWVKKAMSVEGTIVATLQDTKDLLALARAGKIKPPPMREEPMTDIQTWIDALRAGKVTGRIMLKN